VKRYVEEEDSPGDAIQLASALLLRRETAQPVTFAAYDHRLKAAARAEGLTVVP
jgi:hypothetical protein